MATRWDPTSTKYTAAMLQGGPAPGPTSFGTWTPTQIKQMQQAGVTMGDLQNLGLLGPPQMSTPVQNWGSGGGSGGSSGGTIGGQVISPGSQQLQQQNATLLKLMLQGDQPQQQPQNQPPTWNQVGQAAGLSSADISQFQAMNRTPADIAKQFNVLGPQFAGLSQPQFQVPQQVVPAPVSGQPVVPTAQPVKQFQSGGLVTGNQSSGNPYGQAYPLYATDAQGNQTGNALYANPMMQLGLLGAAVTQSYPIINQAPSAALDPKSGVSKVGGALIGSTVPSTGGWNWNSLGNAFGLGQNDIAGYQAKGLSPQQAADQLNSTWNPATATAIGQAAGLSRSDLNALQASGLTPQQVANRFGVQAGVPAPSATPGMQGPWNDPRFGSVFTQVARTAPTQTTPLTAAAQPTAAAYNPTSTPFATPPPAPGLQIPQTPFVAAHTNALADAGKALFAHFGGDPNTAGPADIENFHNQLLTATGAPQPIASQQAWASEHGLTNPTFGSSVAMQPWAGILTPSPQPWAGPAGTAPQPWLTGSRPPPPGMPGTPAEGITALSGEMGPANTAAALAGLRGAPLPPPSGATKKMASGGVVPGRGNQDTVPALLTPGEYVIPRPQVQQLMRTGRLPIKMAGGGTVEDPDPDPSAPPEARRKMISAQTGQAPPPAAPEGSSIHSGLTSGLATAAQTYASSMANLPRNPIGSAGGGPDIRNTRLDPDPDIPYLKAAGMMGGGGMSQGMKSGLSGIGSALTQASKDIAASTPPWQMQQNAIPSPPPAPAAPQFTQPPAPQQAQQGVNPYAAYIANQARYPTSPYYG
jgi:hypothetical protein